jgi:translocation protein SEC63
MNRCAHITTPPATNANLTQGQFFPYFILTVTTLVTVPTTISFLRPSKGAHASLGYLLHSDIDTQLELENTGTRIESDFVPEHADLIQGQRKKQKRLERRLKRGILMVAGWALNAAMVYLILVTARTTPDIWDPYDVLGVSRVCTIVSGELCTGN